MRYSREEVERAAAAAGREILLASLASFGGIAVLAPLALLLVFHAEVIDEPGARMSTQLP